MAGGVPGLDKECIIIITIIITIIIIIIIITTMTESKRGVITHMCCCRSRRCGCRTPPVEHMGKREGVTCSCRGALEEHGPRIVLPPPGP